MALQVAEQMADYLLTGAVVNSLNMPNVSAEDAPKLRALSRPRREARLVRRPAHRHRHQGGGDRVRGPGGGAQHQAAEPGGADGRAAAAARLGEHGQRAGDRPRARHRGRRGQARARQRLQFDDPPHGHHRASTRAPVTGTLFGGKHPRIVEIKGIEIEAEFAPHMLYITNDDKPGFIGRLGTLLGENKVNIATFHLGRDKPGGSAIALVQVDQPISPALTGQDRRRRGRGAGQGAGLLARTSPALVWHEKSSLAPLATKSLACPRPTTIRSLPMPRVSEIEEDGGDPTLASRVREGTRDFRRDLLNPDQGDGALPADPARRQAAGRRRSSSRASCPRGCRR